MAPEAIERPAAAQDATSRRLGTLQGLVPAMYRHLTVADLPEAHVAAVRRWLAGDGLGLWLGGASFRGKTAIGWFVVGHHAAVTGRSFAVVSVTEFLEAKRGIQTPPEAAMIHKAISADIVVLDEWPLTLNAGKDLDYLRDLLNRRATGNRRTVITANAQQGLSTVLTGHPDGAVAEAAKAVDNRIRAMAYCPFHETLPKLPTV